MPIQITPNPRASGRLSLSANQRARMSSVVTVDWDNVTGDKPVIGVDTQAYDADLDAIAGLSATGFPARTATNAWALRTITAGAMMGVTNGAGVAGNPTVAVTDPELLALGGVTSAADKLFYFTGSGTGSLADFSSFGRSLVDDANAGAALTTLTAVGYSTQSLTAGQQLQARSNIGVIVETVATIAALKAIDTTKTTYAELTEAGRYGIFIWRAGNYSSHVMADTNNGIYVQADTVAAASGAWVRQFDFQNYQAKWFGAVDDYSTDNTTLISNMMVVANLQNTNASAGKQSAVYLNIEGGVKFASQNLQWLPSANFVFMNIRYWGNSDTTPGQVSYGTNEHVTLSINSGYPGDVTGGWVAEEMFNAPLHPAIGVNIHKNIDNSVAVHSGPTQRIQPTDAASAKGSIAYIKNENKDVFRIAHEHYGTVTAVNGTLVYVNTNKTSLTATNVGIAGGWGSSSVPIAGGVVRDITTGGRYVVTSLATSILTCDWLSGAAAPGNTLMHERAIFKGSISGTTLTVTAMLQGDGNIASGMTIVGMFANSGITVSTTITGLGTGTGGVGTYTVNNSQTLASTEIVCGFLSVNGIQGGGVSNTDTVNIPLMFGLDGKMYTKDATLLRSRTTLTNGAAAQTATMTNGPAAGNPTKWIPIDDNGTTRYIPAW